MRILKSVFVLCLFLLLAACSPGGSGSTDTPAYPNLPTATETVTLTVEAPDSDPVTPDPVTPDAVTLTICPQATPEWLRVHPVTSPTSELTQTIYISINNGEWVTVSSPAGEFEARAETGKLEASNFFYNFVVDIDLVPDSEQALTVETQIKQIEWSGCQYGGYQLTTKSDINFEPLLIIQEP